MGDSFDKGSRNNIEKAMLAYNVNKSSKDAAAHKRS
jgi:hypothetical protein